MSMHSQARADSDRTRAQSSSPTDWAALEKQLCRTKTILQEILEHLQGVLRNLRSARTGFKSHARPGARPEKPGPKTGFRATRTASAGFGARPQDQKTARPRPGHTRFERDAAGPGAPGGQPGTDEARAAPGDFRTGSAFAGARDAGRPGNPYRSFAGGRAQGAGSAFAGNARSASAGTAGNTQGPGASGATGQPGSSSRFGQTGQAGKPGQAGQGAQAGPGGPYGRTASGQYRQREGFGQTQRPGQARASHSSNAYDTRRETGRPESASRHRFSGERQERGRQAARNSGMNLKNAYDILCLDYPCTPVEIKNAYRGMARMFHPDLGGDEEVMKDINLAYELAMRFCAGPRRSGAAWTV